MPVNSTNITGCPDSVVTWFPVRLDLSVTDRTFDHLVIINVFMYDFTFRKKMEFHAEISVWIFLSIKFLIDSFDAAPAAWETTWPLRKIARVGMLKMLYFDASSLF